MGFDMQVVCNITLQWLVIVQSYYTTLHYARASRH